jgi:hypothetical protein
VLGARKLTAKGTAHLKRLTGLVQLSLYGSEAAPQPHCWDVDSE